VLEAVRVVLTAYTASFRFPHFVGHQLTLPVPPLSTIYGLISAAAGRWVKPSEVEWLAYRCEYEGKGMDMEAIWTVERRKPHESARFETRNIIQREFLAMPCLTLYLPLGWTEVFRRPRYTLLLGRTQDVATVESLQPTNLEFVGSGIVSGVLLPLELVMRNNVSVWLHSLPVAFTDEPQRRPLRVQVFGIVDARRGGEISGADGWLVRDTQSGVILPLFRREWILHGRAETVSEIR
jgi:CRISPR-associated protein Cas5t